MVACTTPTNSQMTGRKPWELQISHQNRIVLLPVCTVSTSGVCKQPSLFWSVTQSHLGAHQITISHVKEDSNTFHMTSNTLMFIYEILIFWHHSYLKQSRPRIVFDSDRQLLKRTQASPSRTHKQEQEENCCNQ